MRRRNENGLTYVDGKGYEGVIYCYRNTLTDKVYVGCTPRELSRRRAWDNWYNRYSGDKLAQARQESKPEDWEYKVLERLYSEDLVELEKILEEREAYYIALYDSCDNGYNSNRGGTGHTGMTRSEETRRKISENHRDYQTEETRKKLSESMMGHEVKESTRQKISQANQGKVRSEEVKQAQSERQKGITPEAAILGAKDWVKKNGGGYWKDKTMSDTARANIKAAQQKRGTKVIAHFPDGSAVTFPTLLDAEKGTGVKVGSIHNNLKHSSEQFKTKSGYWFEKEENDGTTTAND